MAWFAYYQSDELLKEVLEIVNSNERTAAGIVMVGKMPHEQLQNWYNSADFIITGSHYEGSGVAVSEAMSCGCIPVVTDIISFRKMTGPGKCGFLYEAGNVEALLKLLKHTEQIDKEKERVKTLEQFKQELSFDAIALKIHQVVASL